MEDAIYQNDIKKVKFFLDDGYDPNSVLLLEGSGEYSVLELAALLGRYKMAKLLVKKGADVNQKIGEGGPPIHESVLSGNAKLVKFLVDSKASFEKFASALIISAASDGHCDVVKVLLKAKIDVNEIDEDGDTALRYASKNKHLDVVRFLLKNGGK